MVSVAGHRAGGTQLEKYGSFIVPGSVVARWRIKPMQYNIVMEADFESLYLVADMNDE
jgi:hypothetical protein